MSSRFSMKVIFGMLTEFFKLLNDNFNKYTSHMVDILVFSLIENKSTVSKELRIKTVLKKFGPKDFKRVNFCRANTETKAIFENL